MINSLFYKDYIVNFIKESFVYYFEIDSGEGAYWRF